MAAHVSVLSSGQKPKLIKCEDSRTLLCCPFCPLYKGDYARVETHIQSHLKTVVRHGEYVMYTCNRGCRKNSHYHCCVCGMTFTNRKWIMKHLSTCHPQNEQAQPQHLKSSPQQLQRQTQHLQLWLLSQPQHLKSQPQHLKSQPQHLQHQPQHLQLRLLSQLQHLKSEPQHLQPQNLQSLAHFSVLTSGQKPQLQKCEDPECPLLHCPFCPLYKGDYAKVETHIQSHLKSVVRHGEFVMYICNWGCKKDGHFHCCGCDISFTRRKAIMKHLNTCHPQHLHPQPQSIPQPVPQLQPHPERQPKPEPQPELQPVPQFQPEPVPEPQPELQPEPQPKPQSHPNGSFSQVKRVQCTICQVELNRKNLSQHMRRRHNTQPEFQPELQLQPEPVPEPQPKLQPEPQPKPQSHPNGSFSHLRRVQCTICQVELNRKNLSQHMRRRHNTQPELQLQPQPVPEPQPKIQPEPVPEPQPEIQPVPEPQSHPNGSISHVRRVQCTICQVELNRKNLKQHMGRRHNIIKEDIRADRFLASECLDIDLGIYAVLKSFNSKSAPIHVQKKTSGTNHQIRCTLSDCLRIKEEMHETGFVAYDCVHIQSLKYYCPPPLSPKIQLKENVLREIAISKWFSEEKKGICLQKQAAANEEGVPYSVEVKVGSSSTKKFVSVYEPHLSYYNQFGRLMVMLDKVKNTWHCHCATTKQACIHKCIAKWHLFHTMKEYFISVECSDVEESDVSEGDPETQYKNSCEYPPQNKDLKRIVRYIHGNKKLPANLPAYFCGLTSESDLPTHLIPKEQVCPECPGNLALCEPFILTESAKIITVKGVIEGVTTFCKKCSSCGMMIRYQDWEDGVHNFNDKIILTLHFCIYLRNCLQTHTALGQAIETWELTSGQKYPSKNTLIHGYLHFEALSEHDYDSLCVHCGQFWDSVCFESIARGFVPSDLQNPFTIKQIKPHWAPWHETHSHKSKMVLNPEHEKVHVTTQPNEYTEVDLIKDSLLDEISTFKVHSIRKLCKECRINSKGSKMELILRLTEEMATGTKYGQSRSRKRRWSKSHSRSRSQSRSPSRSRRRSRSPSRRRRSQRRSWSSSRSSSRSRSRSRRGHTSPRDLSKELELPLQWV